MSPAPHEGTPPNYCGVKAVFNDGKFRDIEKKGLT